MNDFTKDELNILLLEMNIVIQRTTKEGILSISPIYFKLRDKIQSMIDNYCEHDWQPGKHLFSETYCTKCMSVLNDNQ